MKIEVSEEVGRELNRFCEVVNVNADVLIRGWLKMRESSGAPAQKLLRHAIAPGRNGLITRRGVTLPVGLNLRSRYLGREYRGTVEPGAIAVEGIDKKFTSPSLAGVAITGYAVNGWRFWEYFDETSKTWEPLDKLRQ